MGAKTASITATKLAQIPVQTSALGVCQTIGWGTGLVKPNILDLQDFTAIAHTTKTGGKGGGGVKSTDYTYTTTLLLGLCAGPIASIPGVIVDKANYSSATAAGFSGFASGTIGQAAWGFMSTNHPANALGYSGLAYVYGSSYPLGANGNLPNHQFIVEFDITVTGLPDANPADILTDFLTNAVHGVPGWPSSMLASLTDYSNYCLAANLLLSPVLDTQVQASAFLTDLFLASNSDGYWSEGLIKVRPRGDQSVTANATTWNPDLTPAYALTDDSYLVADGDLPVHQNIIDQTDAYNSVQVEYLDRANQYNTAIMPAQDLANIVQYGKRKQDPKSLHMVADAAIARNVTQLYLQRVLYVRNQYVFDLPWNYALLEPTDLLSINDANMGLVSKLVRIIQIEDDADICRTVTAEEVPTGTAAPPLYSHQDSAGTITNWATDPGDVVAPQIFSAPSVLTQGGLETWAAVAGGVNWGGCQVWVSLDNATYNMVGSILGRARYGILGSGGLPTHADPDDTNTARVVLTQSLGELDSTTLDGENALATMSLIGFSEIISYRDATLFDTNIYDLTHLRRGALGTPIGDWAVTATFTRLDDAIFKFPLFGTQDGQLAYVKFQSFNIYGGGLQDLANCTPYVITPGYQPGAAPASASWTCTGTTLSNSGVNFPAIVVTGACERADAEHIVVEYRISGGTDWVHYDTTPPTMTREEITSVASAQTYDVAISYVYGGVQGARRVYSSITAGTFAGSGGSTDVTPAAVNWANISVTASGVAAGSNADQTITAINAQITLDISWTGTGATFTYIKNGMAPVSIVSGDDVIMNAGDYLHFACQRTTTGTSSGTVTVTNVTDASTVLDTFTYSLTVSSTDVTPDAVNWNDISGELVGYTNTVTISGINTVIQLQFNTSHTSGGAESYAYQLNGGSSVAFTNGATLNVSNGDTLLFAVSHISGIADSVGTVTIVNVTDSNTTLDSFAYDVSRLIP